MVILQFATWITLNYLYIYIYNNPIALTARQYLVGTFGIELGQQLGSVRDHSRSDDCLGRFNANHFWNFLKVGTPWLIDCMSSPKKCVCVCFCFMFFLCLKRRNFRISKAYHFGTVSLQFLYRVIEACHVLIARGWFTFRLTFCCFRFSEAWVSDILHVLSIPPYPTVEWNKHE